MKWKASLAPFHIVVHDELSNLIQVSHIIMHVNDEGLVPRTQAYIRAIHEGKWIVSHDCKSLLCLCCGKEPIITRRLG